MTVLYRLGKSSVVTGALSLLLMESVAHVEHDKKEIVRDVHRLL